MCFLTNTRSQIIPKRGRASKTTCARDWGFDGFDRSQTDCGPPGDGVPGRGTRGTRTWGHGVTGRGEREPDGDPCGHPNGFRVCPGVARGAQGGAPMGLVFAPRWSEVPGYTDTNVFRVCPAMARGAQGGAPMGLGFAPGWPEGCPRGCTTGFRVCPGVARGAQASAPMGLEFAPGWPEVPKGVQNWV